MIMMHCFLQIISVMITVYYFCAGEKPTADEQGVLQRAAQAVAVPWYPGQPLAAS